MLMSPFCSMFNFKAIHISGMKRYEVRSGGRYMGIVVCYDSAPGVWYAYACPHLSLVEAPDLDAAVSMIVDARNRDWDK